MILAMSQWGEYVLASGAFLAYLLASVANKKMASDMLRLVLFAGWVLPGLMLAEGLLAAPPMYQLCLGIPWGADQTVETMKAMKEHLPPGASWASFGISRMQMPMAAAAVALGGNVRVGLEDNLFLDRGVLATNAQLVERVIGIIERMGARVQTPQQARNSLKLRGADA